MYQLLKFEHFTSKLGSQPFKHRTGVSAETQIGNLTTLLLLVILDLISRHGPLFFSIFILKIHTKNFLEIAVKTMILLKLQYLSISDSDRVLSAIE